MRKLVLKTLSRMVPRRMKDYVRDQLLVKDEVFGASIGRIDPNVMTIFDIGANVGDVTLYMLDVFPDATIYSFEPCSTSFERLSQRVAASPHGNRVKLFNFGFYNEQGSRTLHVTSHHGANSMVDITPEFHEANPQVKERDIEDIALVRLDDFIAEEGVAHIDLMKIDVEGVEAEVISGGLKTMKSKVDIVMCEVSFVRHPRAQGEFIRLFKLMHECGFAPAEFYDLWQGGTGTPWRLGQLDCVFRRFDA